MPGARNQKSWDAVQRVSEGRASGIAGDIPKLVSGEIRALIPDIQRPTYKAVESAK